MWIGSAIRRARTPIITAPLLALKCTPPWIISPTPPAASGTWAVDKLAKNASFTLRTAKYVKLISLSSADGDPWANAAEVQVCSVDMSEPVEPVVVLPVQIFQRLVR